MGRLRSWATENTGKLIAYTLLAGLAGLGIALVQGTADDARDAAATAERASVENCRTSNEDRALLVDFLRRELTVEEGDPPPEPFMVRPEYGPDLRDFIEHQVNPFLEQIGVTVEADDTAEAESLLDRAEETFVARECGPRVGPVPMDHDPLGPYQRQRVANRVEGLDGPAMHYGETSRIAGTLCSSAERELTVLTTITWQAVDRTGTFVTVGRDVRQHREPGCVDYEFRNPMPPEVVAASEAIRADGDRAVWVVTGFEIPLLADGSEGGRQPFTSERFEIVP